MRYKIRTFTSVKYPFAQFPLGVLAKNESKNEDMVDILETIQQKYVQFVQMDLELSKTPADLLFFGGDQLTEEQARNIQRARADGNTV